jgi:2-keto-4-pentenoate hydratase
MRADESLIADLARQFILAEDQAEPIEPISSLYPNLTIEDAYRIQMAAVEAKLRRGDKIVGKKVGATSAAVQEQFGIAEPLYANMLKSHRIANGATISRSRLIDPRFECEIAFLLGQDLAGPGVTVADVLAATEAVMASIEVNDCRTRDWKVSVREIVSDNNLIAGFVLADRQVPVAGLDLPGIRVTLKKNGVVIDEAKGEAVLGNPANSMAWLANKLGAEGSGLKAGEVVITGSPTQLHPVDAGDTVEGVFEELGSVSVQFV